MSWANPLLEHGAFLVAGASAFLALGSLINLLQKARASSQESLRGAGRAPGADGGEAHDLQGEIHRPLDANLSQPQHARSDFLGQRDGAVAAGFSDQLQLPDIFRRVSAFQQRHGA